MQTPDNFQHFKAGFIAVVGRPNVGKSTLINELIGQKLSITSHKPQTTRHRINAINSTDEYQMVLVDTPGIHIGNKRALNSYMNKTASSSLVGVDVVLWLLDSHHFTKEDERVLEHIKTVECPVICCLNKIDKFNTKPDILKQLTKLAQFHQGEIIPISAFNKKDVAYLKNHIIGLLPQQAPIFDPNYLTDRSDKFIVAEFIREKLMRRLSDELPYGATVEIEHFKQENGLYRISAKILVERDSQKRIVIGKQGQMLKDIGTDARKNIEDFLNSKVYLKLWVKTQENWSDDKRSLQSLGYD